MFECAGRHRVCGSPRAYDPRESTERVQPTLDVQPREDASEEPETPRIVLDNDMNKKMDRLSQRLAAVEEYLQGTCSLLAATEKMIASQEADQQFQENTKQRLQELETASARITAMLPSFATGDQIAQLAPVPELRAQQEAIDTAQFFSRTASDLINSSTQLQERLSNLERSHSSFTKQWTDAFESLRSKEQSLEQILDELKGQAQGVDKDLPDLENTMLKEIADPKGDSSLEALGDVQETDLYYFWHDSIWDLSIFVGTHLLTPGASLVVLVCLLVNIVLLAAFISQCHSLTESDFDQQTQADFDIWRTTMAHDVSFRNSITGESMASVVCNQKLYSAFSNFQLGIVHELNDYLKNPDLIPLPFPNGAVMCLLSLAVWYLTLSVEVRNILEIFAAFWSLPRGSQHTMFEQDSEDKSTQILVSVSYCKLCSLILILLLRFSVVVLLGFEGTLFLVHEHSLENMILNSIALNFMLSFDELMYWGLVPKLPQRVIRFLRPLKRTKKGWFHHFWNDAGVFIALSIICILAFVLSFAVYLDPFIDSLRGNLDALCGGGPESYGFVVAVDAIGIPWAAPASSNSMSDTYAHNAIVNSKEKGFQALQGLEPQQRSNMGFFMQVDSGETLENIVTSWPEFTYPTDWVMVYPKNIQQIVGSEEEFYVLGNKDFGDMQGTVYNHYLKHLLKIQEGVNVTCAQAPFDLCTRPGASAKALVLRQLCPNRCGCATPTEGISGFLGCAPWNSEKKVFVEKLQDLPCSDTTNRDDLIIWARGFGQAHHVATESLLSDHLLTVFDSEGCHGLVEIEVGVGARTRVCEATSIASLCPWSCGCNSSSAWAAAHAQNTLFCPYSCYKGGKAEALSPSFCITQRIPNTVVNPRGPHAGFPCQFPFMYKGKTYHTCTTFDHNGPWCAVTVADGLSTNWGDCADSCPSVPR